MSKLTKMKLGEGNTKLSSTQLANLLSMQDKDIDTSDIPEITETWLKKAKIVKFKPKVLKSIRIDSNVLTFLQLKQGKGYQTLINNILTEWAEHHGMSRR
jgi:uncharacterized protein (DUF4415 family)